MADERFVVATADDIAHFRDAATAKNTSNSTRLGRPLLKILYRFSLFLQLFVRLSEYNVTGAGEGERRGRFVNTE